VFRPLLTSQIDTGREDLATVHKEGATRVPFPKQMALVRPPKARVGGLSERPA